ncbi:APC family permease [Thermofilum pendens]|uniref:Amino acid permease-associated region n=1 Tax=Thermofilum pendens (strain DSM 2475 / Hrk 5) TaxID=368408 RepID=A1RZG4_THEPD|nr:APC family permease [Thermofilum pendens]ABL78594.1 amino acid permease-associated region [Thermofilum pendens Hrk 5]
MGEQRLRRRIGLLEAFSFGYADVGAGIYMTLGLVAAYAGPATPLAFAVASVSYLFTALSYAELSAAYPEAGGGMVFADRAFGRLAAFIAGWSLLLDYVVTGSIFALSTTGYLGHLFPLLKRDEFFGPVAALLVFFLVVLNILGIRESAAFSSALVLLDIAGLSVIMGIGYLTSFKPFFDKVNLGVNPDWQSFMYGSTLAMASYLGIEVISQTAEETRRAGATIPRAVKLVSVVVIFFALLFSTLAVGTVGWEVLAASQKDPAAVVAEHLPYGSVLALWVSVIGMTVCYAATNTGIVGVSRMVYAMGREGMLPRWLTELHGRFKTPYRAIVVFAVIQLLLAYVGHLGLAADLYNFGALLSYMVVNLSVLALRVKDPHRYRPYKVPGNVPLRVGGRKVYVPLGAVLGFLTNLAMWLMVVSTHKEGRLVGFAWLLAGLLVYAVYSRRRRAEPLTPSSP